MRRTEKIEDLAILFCLDKIFSILSYSSSARKNVLIRRSRRSEIKVVLVIEVVGGERSYCIEGSESELVGLFDSSRTGRKVMSRELLSAVRWHLHRPPGTFPIERQSMLCWPSCFSSLCSLPG